MNLSETLIGEVLNKAKNLYLKPIWFEVFSDVKFKEQILDWIRFEQLAKGVDENGFVQGFYSEFTESIDPTKVAGTPYTFFDTGDFYRSMFIVVLYDASIVIDADGIKVDESGEETDLFRKFGEGLVGLTAETKEKLNEELIKRFNEKATAILLND